MRHMKSTPFSQWLKRRNDAFSVDFLFRWCVNHNMQEWINHNTQEWIVRYIVVSFNMVQPGIVSDTYWILLNIILKKCFYAKFHSFSFINFLNSSFQLFPLFDNISLKSFKFLIFLERVWLPGVAECIPHSWLLVNSKKLFLLRPSYSSMMCI